MTVQSFAERIYALQRRIEILERLPRGRRTIIRTITTVCPVCEQIVTPDPDPDPDPTSACAYLPFDHALAVPIGDWGDFNDHPGNCNEAGDYITFFGDDSGIEFTFDLTADQAAVFNAGYLGIVGQSYCNGTLPTYQLEVNSFSYTLTNDDAAGGLPNFTTGSIGTGDWEFHRYNTADIVGDAPWQTGSNTVRVTVTDRGSVAISGRIEFEAIVLGPLDTEDGCMTRDPDTVCFTCGDGCNVV